MILNKETVYTKDQSGKKLKVVREFDASVEKVWKAWTTPEILDEWWAPKPWKTNTVSMDFRKGGRWFYFMQGPENERHYCLADYKSVTANKNFSLNDAFCDEKQNINKDMPSTHWDVAFNGKGDTTKVEVELTFASEEDRDKLVEMGFKEGFAMAHENLDELLASKDFK